MGEADLPIDMTALGEDLEPLSPPPEIEVGWSILTWMVVIFGGMLLVAGAGLTIWLLVRKRPRVSPQPELSARENALEVLYRLKTGDAILRDGGTAMGTANRVFRAYVEDRQQTRLIEAGSEALLRELIDRGIELQFSCVPEAEKLMGGVVSEMLEFVKLDPFVQVPPALPVTDVLAS